MNIAGLLLVLFVALKLLGKVSWPWIWVLAPGWIPLVGAVMFAVFCLALAILKEVDK